MPRKGPNTSLLGHTGTALHALLSQGIFAFSAHFNRSQVGRLALDLVMVLPDSLVVGLTLLLFSRFLLFLYSIL